MKKIRNMLLILTSIVTFSSSCSFLDVTDYFEDTLNIDSVFQNRIYLERYLWGAAALLPDPSNIFRNSYYPAILGSDEGFTMWEDDYAAQRFPLDRINADNLGPMNTWAALYQVIRKANTIFARINECPGLSGQERREIIGYAHFLRGYSYYYLLLNYGPLLIVGDQVYDTSLPAEAYQKYRSTYDESVDYVCNELELAASYIPADVPIPVFGRPTKGAAYGLIARLRVYAASPLFNGGQAARIYFSDFKRQSDKVNYISQTYDEQKWAVAAAACKRVMDMSYQLHTVEASSSTPRLPEGVLHDPNYYKNWPEGANGIDHFKSYSEMFNGETLGFRNKEFVFGMKSAEVTNASYLSFPAQFGGWNGYGIPQKVIDAYRMADGRGIENSSTLFPYSEEGFSTRDSTFSGYLIKANVNSMYLNREPRFYASIGYHGCFWPMNSTTESGKFAQQVFYSIDGNAGKSASVGGDTRNYPITGYVSKKYIHPDDAWSGSNAAVLEKSFSIVRLADIRLMYAESLNNLTRSYQMTDTITGNTFSFSRDVNEIATAFNSVRYRSGLPGLTPDELANPDLFFEALKRERLVEFLHEGLRYYDTRRWGIVAEEEAKPIMGMDTERTERAGYFNRVIANYTAVRNRTFKPKMILLPIDRQEIMRVQTLDQNPGWEQ
ncbi:MAG TPA: RagB/SusD family nutrient uptake outer membrane protein [Parapedobacter sp.]|uniref:RagB/SusD family nutrient uptake outer membrane protein n=1 Tax=Parapedobacter sp. TaxID=1958893 RepID=UPI002C5CDBC1|nr:RagB/SusD family nutrient uptake outer membrane protein [Parapedobacter sp.]HWK56668.1 RagB/SusD family nutrient uptake outer membrane protein [Parapedobacter sp.]